MIVIIMRMMMMMIEEHMLIIIGASIPKTLTTCCPPLPSLRQMTDIEDIVGKPHCGCHILHYYCVLDSSSSSKG